MMDWSKRGNINTAALVTIVQCNTLVAQCSRQLIGPADWVFGSFQDHYTVISLEAVTYSSYGNTVAIGLTKVRPLLGYSLGFRA